MLLCSPLVTACAGHSVSEQHAFTHSLYSILVLQSHPLDLHFVHGYTVVISACPCEHQTWVVCVGICRNEVAVTCEWAPDGRHFLTATVAPRLNVDNGYQIYRLALHLCNSCNMRMPTPMSIWQVCPLKPTWCSAVRWPFVPCWQTKICQRSLVVTSSQPLCYLRKSLS